MNFTLDGRPVPLTDWQFDSAADWGDRTLTGKLPRWVMWAEQETPIVAWDEEAKWSGKLTLDPVRSDDLWSIRAEGNASALEEDRTRMFYRIDGANQWASQEGDPHNYAASPKFDIVQGKSSLSWKWGNNADAFASGDEAGFVLWVEGGLITRYSCIGKGVSAATYDFRVRRLTGPSGSVTLILDAATATGDADTAFGTTISSPEDAINFAVRANGANTPNGRRRFHVRAIKVYGRTTDDAFSVSDVVSDVGSSAGLDVSNVTQNSLGALPLDWLEAHPDLLTYMAELTDWRWMSRHDGLHFGPYEKTWEASSTEDLISSLTPERRYNRVHVPYDALSLAPRVAVGIPTVDPFPGREVVFEMEKLEDPQSDSLLADSVAQTRAEYEASARLTGSVEVGRIHYRGETRDPEALNPGDLLSLTDLAPDIGPQRVKSVTYRPNGVTAELGSGFNVVRTMAEAERQRRSRVRKRRRRRAA